MPHFAIYVRRSHKRKDAASVSDETQEQMARALLPPDATWEVITDTGGHRSGATTERDGYQDLLAKLRAGRIDGIAVYDLATAWAACVVGSAASSSAPLTTAFTCWPGSSTAAAVVATSTDRRPWPVARSVALLPLPWLRYERRRRRGGGGALPAHLEGGLAR